MKDIIRVNSNETAYIIVNGEVKGYRRRNLQKAGARLWNGTNMASASFTGEINDEKMYSECEKNSATSIPYDVELPKNSEFKNSLMGQIPVTKDELRKLTTEVLNRVNKEVPGIKVQGKATWKQKQVIYRNDQGVEHEIEHPYVDIGLEWRGPNSQSICDGFCQFMGMVEMQPEKNLNYEISLMKAFSQEVAMTSGRHKVLWAISENFLGRRWTDNFRVDRYSDGTALYKNKLGKTLFSDKFSLYDSRYNPELVMCRPFDGEGSLQPEALPLVEKGVYKNNICDLRYGKKYDQKTTGNGRRSTESGVFLGFNDLTIGRGERNFQEIIANTDQCVLAVLGTGGDFTDAGDFATPIQMAYLVRDGKIQGRLPQISVNANINDMLGKDLIEVASTGAHHNYPSPAVMMEMNVQVN